MSHSRFASRAIELAPAFATPNPSLIRLGGGSAFPDLLPDLGEVAKQVSRDFRTEVFQYPALFGIPDLREAITEYTADDGVIASPENILVTNGAKQALDLLLRAYVEKGDKVIVSRPTYLTALMIIRSHEATFMEVDVDEHGMKVDELEASLIGMRASGQRMPKLLFEVPDFHNPTAATLSIERRQKLVALAEEFEFIIMEDDPYRRVRFEGKAVPPIKSFDTKGYVVATGTVSKIYTPGLRVGWANGDPKIIGRMAALKSEGGSSSFNQRIIFNMMKSGDLRSHIGKVTTALKDHKNAMCVALKEYIPEVEYERPAGGYYLWLKLPDGLDADQVSRAAEDAGVVVFSGSLFFPTPSRQQFVRLAFSYHKPAEITEGIRRLGQAIRNATQANIGQPAESKKHYESSRHFD